MKRTETTGVHRRDPMIDALIRERPTSSVPPAMPGEKHRSLEEMADDLAALARPIAKVRPERARREALNSEALERFRLAVDRLDANGWSLDRLARHLGCTQTTLKDVYDGHRYVSAWMLDAMPDVQVELAQKRIEQLQRRRAG